MVFQPGSQIGKYILRRKLGQGGFGHVFAALDASLDRDVALKFLRHEHTTSPEIVRRFLQEARSAAKIIHPGIVTVFECGQVAGTGTEADGTAYIAMELLEGETLTDRLARGGRMPPAIVMEIGRQLASALEAAHRAGIVHRDLKPDNIFLVGDSAVFGGERVKVLDFGIAKLAGPVAPTLATQSAIVFGTPRYMSPEQCRSAAAVDHRSDIYTLGCILFELATGRIPFEGESGELIAQHILVPPPYARDLAPELPATLADLIARMLEKSPDARPTTMAAVQRALENAGALAHGVAPTQPPDPGDVATVLPGDTMPQMRTFAALAAPPIPTPTPSSLASRAKPKSTTLSSVAAESVVQSRAPRPRIEPALKTKLAVFGAAAAIVLAIPIAVYLALRDPGASDAHTVAEAPRGASSITAAIPPQRDRATPPAPAAQPEVATPVAPDPPSTTSKAKRRDRTADKDRRKSGAAAPDPRDATISPPGMTKSRGALTVVSKPACDIFIDGKPTGLRTPQIELALPAGKHKIVLLDHEHAIRDAFSVEIEAGATAHVSKDYSDKLERKRSKRQPDRDDETINPFAKDP